MVPQSLPDNTLPLPAGPLLALLPPEKRRRVTEILRGFNLPPEEHEEYLVAMLYHLQIALDAYLSRFREPQDSNVQIP